MKAFSMCLLYHIISDDWARLGGFAIRCWGPRCLIIGRITDKDIVPWRAESLTGDS
jgi:hypothetical protein